MKEEVFHRLGDVLDELDKIKFEAGEYKSDIVSAYSDLNDLYEAVKEVYGYKDNSDKEQVC